MTILERGTKPISKVMASLPMQGRSDEEIRTTINKIKTWIEEHGYTFVDTLFTNEELGDDIQFPPLYYLSRSLAKMSECDSVYFAPGWEAARGCQIEAQAATKYGLNRIYETSSE